MRSSTLNMRTQHSVLLALHNDFNLAEYQGLNNFAVVQSRFAEENTRPLGFVSFAQVLETLATQATQVSEEFIDFLRPLQLIRLQKSSTRYQHARNVGGKIIGLA